RGQLARIDEGRSERPNSTKTLAYDFLGRPKPKIFSKNRPDISIRNHKKKKNKQKKKKKKNFFFFFFGAPQKPKFFSKNRPDISIRNHQNEKRRDCTACLQKSLITNGDVLSVSKPKVERFFWAGCLFARLN